MTTETMNTEQMWELLESYEIANEDELRLVTDICGYNEKALLDILYARTGYRNFEQLEEEY